MDEQEQRGRTYFWKLNLKGFTELWHRERMGQKSRTELPTLQIENSEFKQLNVLAYILQNVHAGDNTVILTYKKIADDTKVSKDRVTRIMRRLGKLDFIRKLQNGVYIVNPRILVWGSESKREALCLKYEVAQKLGREPDDDSSNDK